MLTYVRESHLGSNFSSYGTPNLAVFKGECSAEGLYLINVDYREVQKLDIVFTLVISALRRQRQADHYRLRHQPLTLAKKSKA